MNLLSSFCFENEIPFGSLEAEKFSFLSDCLIEKNKVMNLTAITDPADVEVKHFIDSAAAVPVLRRLAEGRECSVIDVGTGAGFPGLPLAILMPDFTFHLIDATIKKIDYIKETASALALTNVTAESGRAEELGHGPLRGAFDFCVSRAVAELRVLLEYCLPFVRTGGFAVFYKSGDFESELAAAATALKEFGGEVKDIIEFPLNGSSGSRSFIVVKKGKATPDKYPRRPGKPSKSPLSNK